MKIKSVTLNKKKQVISIDTKKGEFDLPFAKLHKPYSSSNQIKEIYVDTELGREAITYELQNGELDSVHLDIFLDYSKDPDFLKMLFLFELTIKAQEALKESKLSKNEVCRRLKTSASQLARLLDQTNHKKSVDKMLELLAVLGVNVKPSFEAA